MTEEVKCSHIWAHEAWAKAGEIGDNEQRRYPHKLYMKGSNSNQCDVSICGLITQSQWRDL